MKYKKKKDFEKKPVYIGWNDTWFNWTVNSMIFIVEVIPQFCFQQCFHWHKMLCCCKNQCGNDFAKLLFFTAALQVMCHFVHVGPEASIPGNARVTRIWGSSVYEYLIGSRKQHFTWTFRAPNWLYRMSYTIWLNQIHFLIGVYQIKVFVKKVFNIFTLELADTIFGV